MKIYLKSRHMNEKILAPLKKIKYEAKKQINFKLLKHCFENDRTNHISDTQKHLILEGECKINSIKINNLVAEFCQRYALHELHLKKGPKNLSVPLFDDIAINQIYSIIYKEVSLYYTLMFGCEAFLQDSPRLVITYPEYDHKTGEKQNNFPELFHKDYFTEVTVHVPLVNISEQTPYTEYVQKTHMQPRFLDKLYLSNKAKNTYSPKSMLCDVGNYLIMDVNGVHRGSTTTKTHYRTMIQYKFVAKPFKRETNLLSAFEVKKTAEKYKNSIKYTLDNLGNLRVFLDKVKSNSYKGILDDNQVHAKHIFEHYCELLDVNF